MATPYEERQRRRSQAFQARRNSDQQRYLMTLGPEERAEYLANQRAVITGEQQPPAQAGPQNPQPPVGQQAQQPAPDVHFHIPRPPDDERSPLDRMIDRTEQAFKDENDSRVAQAREAKRMQTAKDIEGMRQEGLLKRLQAMNDSSYEQPAPPPGGPVGVFDPEAGQFRYYNGVRFG